MTTQNLFEKYGIKDVANVTIYSIEKKEETYESQRKITASSVLKGALELRDVYPLNTDGVGEEEGFKAYVFTDATLIKGTNYDCDDESSYSATVEFRYIETSDSDNVETVVKGIQETIEQNKKALLDAAISGEGAQDIADGKLQELALKNIRNLTTERKATIDVLQNADGVEEDSVTIGKVSLKKEESKTVGTSINELFAFPVTFKIIIDEEEKKTGVYDNKVSASPDSSKEVGTHEYTYAEQICMLFSKRQNILAKTGVRYVFDDADTFFGDITFNDKFAAAPYSTERVVVAGLADKFDEGSYDLDEINDVMSQLKESIEAKAYDVTYGDYAELVVEDEMGYYNPDFLGKNYVRNKGIGSITFFDEGNTYADYAGEKVDNAIEDAVMWSDGLHYSINDAIDALKQKKLILDASEESGVSGIDAIFGGYKVSSKATDENATPEPGAEDTDTEENIYKYKVDGDTALVDATNKKGDAVTSKYPLADVVDAVNDIGRSGVALGKAVRVDTEGKTSNRAIYIKVENSVDTAAGAYIYLLQNKNAKKLSTDKEGIFKFVDKKGNTLYYQDKIFKGVEYLALVILGDKGIIFCVNRHGNKNITRVGWVVNNNGYITNNQAKSLVENGLIHTTDITVDSETFEATCTVSGLKTHTTKKVSNHYTPVLFLETLKVSTIEQTAEEVFATGGRGNANLIGWDYGKEITLSLQDALFSPASMAATFGGAEGGDLRKAVKQATVIDNFEPYTAKRSFIVPSGNQNGTPSEADKTAQAVYYDPATMQPYPDGTPIAEGERFLKYTRSVAYEGQSLGNVIEISADKFPGIYKVVGDTYVKSKSTGEEHRFQFVIPQAKMSSEQTITLEADGDPAVFDMNMTVLRPDDGVMVRLVQYDVVENTEENDGSMMVKGTENLNLLDDAELFKVSAAMDEEEVFIGATEY